MDNIKIKQWICDILLFLCFTAIAFFAGKILINQWKYKKAQKEYDTLQKAVQTEKSINWKKLKRINKDIVAWIKVPGTKVSYPIVQGKDNSTYLHRTFHKKYNPSGCIFLDYKCKKDFMSDNNVIYGHHMRDGSMFATFVKYKNRSFWKKHQKIILYLPKETRTLKVIAARANKPENYRLNSKIKRIEKIIYQEFNLLVIYQIRVSGNDCIHLLLVVMRKTITGLIFMQLKIRKK